MIERVSQKQMLQSASKFVTYPILGNLSHYHKQWIECKVGKNWFDAQSATGVSMFTNTCLYSTLLFMQSPGLGQPNPGDVIPYLISGLSVGSVEFLFRYESIRSHNNYPGSLVGEVFSYIFDKLTKNSQQSGRNITPHINSAHIDDVVV